MATRFVCSGFAGHDIHQRGDIELGKTFRVGLYPNGHCGRCLRSGQPFGCCSSHLLWGTPLIIQAKVHCEWYGPHLTGIDCLFTPTLCHQQVRATFVGFLIKKKNMAELHYTWDNWDIHKFFYSTKDATYDSSLIAGKFHYCFTSS